MMEEEPEIGWCWRNCRSFGIGVIFLVWPWRFGLHKADNVYEGCRGLCFGPLALHLEYGIGNCSSENRLEAALSLSELEAWERALKCHGIEE